MSTELYQINYNAMMSLPMVKSLVEKNKKLRKENKSLRNLICSLPEFRPKPPAANCGCCCDKQHNIDKSSDVFIKKEPISHNMDKSSDVFIKKEPISHNTSIVDDDDQNYVEYIEKPPITKNNNIVYTIIETEPDVVYLNNKRIEPTHSSHKIEARRLETEFDFGYHNNKIFPDLDRRDNFEKHQKSKNTFNMIDTTPDRIITKEDPGETVEDVEYEEVDETEEDVDEYEEVEETDEDAEYEEVDETEEVDGEDEDEEVFEFTIDGTAYYITNEINGIIYNIDENEDVGDEIGKLINGVPNFIK
jgi:hypothetical protein